MVNDQSSSMLDVDLRNYIVLCDVLSPALVSLNVTYIKLLLTYLQVILNDSDIKRLNEWNSVTV